MFGMHKRKQETTLKSKDLSLVLTDIVTHSLLNVKLYKTKQFTNKLTCKLKKKTV